MHPPPYQEATKKTGKPKGTGGGKYGKVQ